MRSEVKLYFDVKVYPYEDDPWEYIKFSVNSEKLSKETVRFEILDGKDRDPMYFGVVSDGGWFLDPENMVGTFIGNSMSAKEIAEYLEEVDEYDMDDCYAIAESIELLSKAFTSPFMPEPDDDYLPF